MHEPRINENAREPARPPVYAITGASGFIGARFVENLLAAWSNPHLAAAGFGFAAQGGTPAALQTLSPQQTGDVAAKGTRGLLWL